MSNFEWRTEDEYSWDQDPQQPPEKRSVPRWLKLLPLLVLLFGVGGLIVWRGVQQRVSDATTQAQSDALSSAKLLIDSAENNDPELIANLLSGSDQDWASAQRELSQGEGLFDRSAFGLTQQDNSIVLGGATLSADLNSAEITATVQYTTRFETVTLELTKTYRRGATYWLLAPPENAFWGDTITGEGNESIDLVFPNRDRDIILDKLLPDLSVALAKARLSLSSPHLVDIPIRVRFQPDPALLLGAKHALLPGNELQIDLATPSLAGIPIDLRSYMSLRNGYERQLMEIVLLEYGKPPLTTAHIEHQLAALELIDPPAAPPIPYPTADIVIGCDTDIGAMLFRGSLPDGGWTRLFEGGASQLRELPDQQGVVVLDMANSRSTLLVDNSAINLPDGWEIVGPYQGDPRRLHLRRIELNDGPEVKVGVLELGGISAESAPIDITPVQGIVQWSPDGKLGLTYDGISRSGLEIRIIDQDSIVQASLTRSESTRPFWVGETLIGWRVDELSYQLYDFVKGETREWLMMSDLHHLLPQGGQVANPSLTIMPASNAAAPFQLIVQINEGAVPRYLLSHNVDAGQLDYLGQLTFMSFVDVSETGRYLLATRDMPNGDPASGLRLIAYDQRSSEISVYPISAYADVRSPINDDNWLMILDSDTLRLVAPSINYEQYLDLPAENCRSAVWVADTAEIGAISPENSDYRQLQSTQQLTERTPMQALDLEQYQWDSRLLILYADSPSNPDYLAQLAALESATPGLFDRDLLTFHLFADDSGRQGETRFMPQSVRNQLERWGLPDQTFGLLLIGLDGTIKRRELNAIAPELLFSQIDQMPMRQQELDQRATP